MEHAKTLEITEVDDVAEGDVKFPKIPDFFRVIETKDGEYNGLNYKFITYENNRK